MTRLRVLITLVRVKVTLVSVEMTLMRVEITLERLKSHSGVYSENLSVAWQKYILNSTGMRVNFTQKRVIFTHLRAFIIL
jgi:hypothetical protein